MDVAELGEWWQIRPPIEVAWANSQATNGREL